LIYIGCVTVLGWGWGFEGGNLGEGEEGEAFGLDSDLRSGGELLVGDSEWNLGGWVRVVGIWIWRKEVGKRRKNEGR